MPPELDTDILAAAVTGYQAKLNEINQRMADLRRRIGVPAQARPHPRPR